jgi:hypothetical protein
MAGCMLDLSNPREQQEPAQAGSGCLAEFASVVQNDWRCGSFAMGGEMPWIKQVAIARATGLLKRQFDAAIERAGRVWNIMHVMSLNAEAMRGSIRFYTTLMMGESPLTRVQRELLATVVSAELDCHY